MTTTNKVLVAVGILAVAGIGYGFVTRNTRKGVGHAKVVSEADKDKAVCQELNEIIVPKIREFEFMYPELSDWQLTDLVTKMFDNLHKSGKLLDVGNNPFSMTRDQKLDALKRFRYWGEQVAKECKTKHAL